MSQEYELSTPIKAEATEANPTPVKAEAPTSGIEAQISALIARLERSESNMHALAQELRAKEAAFEEQLRAKEAELEQKFAEAFEKVKISDTRRVTRSMTAANAVPQAEYNAFPEQVLAPAQTATNFAPAPSAAPIHFAPAAQPTTQLGSAATPRKYQPGSLPPCSTFPEAPAARMETERLEDLHATLGRDFVNKVLYVIRRDLVFKPNDRSKVKPCGCKKMHCDQGTCRCLANGVICDDKCGCGPSCRNPFKEIRDRFDDAKEIHARSKDL